MPSTELDHLSVLGVSSCVLFFKDSWSFDFDVDGFESFDREPGILNGEKIVSLMNDVGKTK